MLRPSSAWYCPASLFALIGIAAPAPAWQGPPQPDPFGVTNLGLDYDRHAVVGDYLVFKASELGGGLDLNGDGDVGDQVLHSIHLETGVLVNHQLAAAELLPFNSPAGQLFFRVHEFSQGGQDLNGDGDGTDFGVLFVFDGATGEVESLNITTQGLLVHERTLYNAVREDGNDLDLNGDGDASDFVLHTIDLDTGASINHGLAVDNGGIGPLHPDGNTLVFRVSEFRQGGQDLNGNGVVHVSEKVFHILDVPSGVVTNLGPTHPQQRAVWVGNTLVFGVHEFFHRADLNGDGDRLDSVVHLFERNTGAVSNLGFAAAAVSGPRTVATGEEIFLSVLEFGEGDLNGDGDDFDDVWHVLDVPSRVLTNSGLDTSGSHFIRVGTNRFFSVSEGRSDRDFNADGDKIDSVLHVYEGAAGVFTNLGLAAGRRFLVNERLAMRISESSQGQTDLNGDGDALDNVLHFLDPSLLTLENTFLAVRRFGHELAGGSQGPVLVVFLEESGFGVGVDYNNDGDLLDAPIQLLNLSEGSLLNVGLDGIVLALNERFLVCTVNESQQGNADLNGDGDTDDAIVHLVDLGLLALPGLLQALVDDVVALNLQQGISNSLDAKLDAALQALEDLREGNDQAVLNVLQAFITQVAAQSGNQISEVDGAELIASAQEIIDLLSGP